MQKEDGSIATSFKEIADMGVAHFKGLYKEPKRVNIAEILKITSYFPSFVGEEENDIMIEEVTKE